MYETMAGLEQGVVIHSNVLSKNLRRALNVARLVVCEWNRTTSAVTLDRLWCGCVVHKLFQAGLGVQHVEVVVLMSLSSRKFGRVSALRACSALR